jgi:chaperonin cofactor prefoldin
MIFSVVGRGYAADDQAAPSTPNALADKQSLGGQAGTAARELKGTADESLSTGAMKVAESSKKVEAEVQDTLKTLQQQWDVLAKQLQEKTREIQAQLQQQWQDFQRSLNKPQP